MTKNEEKYEREYNRAREQIEKQMGTLKKGAGTMSTAMVLAVAVFAVSGGTVAAALVVDSLDVSPGHPLYSLERLNEEIGSFINVGEYDEQLAAETAGEFASMAETGNAERYLGMAVEVQNRIDSTIVGARDDAELVNARLMVCDHIVAMDQVYADISESAKNEILPSMIRSAKSVQVISGMQTGLLDGNSAGVLLDEGKIYTDDMKNTLCGSDGDLSSLKLAEAEAEMYGVLDAAPAEAKGPVQMVINRIQERMSDLSGQG